MKTETQYSAEKADEEIFKNGEALAMTDLNKERMEDFVHLLRFKSGAKVDWSYAGGRVIIKFLGERAPVEAAFTELLPVLGALQAARTMREFPSLQVSDSDLEPNFCRLS